MYDFEKKIPIYSIFALILILSGGYIIQLIPCKVQNILNNNMYIKHLMCFLTLLVFVSITDPSNDKIVLYNIFLKTIAVYIVFIFIIKTHYIFFIAILCILGASYIITLKVVELKTNIDDINKNIEEEEDDTQKNLYVNKLNTLITLRDTFFIIIGILILIGFIIYLGEKKFEYKNKFSYLTFIFGKPICTNIDYKESLVNSFKYAFK